ncbi:MAG: STAS domain-containing protein [Chitinivibrionales bacterium]|nr:STAS domain-containing protein [Chitinivibrionales bacterium]
MKCYEITGCSPAEREACFVFSSFQENPVDMENVKCWVLKGVYRENNHAQLLKCRQCKYYLRQNAESGIATDLQGDQTIISCEGVLNNDRSKTLEKVWTDLKRQGKINVILNCANVNNIYSCGLGVIIGIHKDAQSLGGMLVVTEAAGYVLAMLESTKLTRVLHCAETNRAALEIFERARTKAQTAAVKKAAVPPAPPKKRPPCWEYWKGQNPSNATSCAECYRKINPSPEPCWLVEGMIEGISFKYVDEECEACRYYQEFGAHAE